MSNATTVAGYETTPAEQLAILTDELQAEHDRYMAELDHEEELESRRADLLRRGDDALRV